MKKVHVRIRASSVSEQDVSGRLHSADGYDTAGGAEEFKRSGAHSAPVSEATSSFIEPYGG